MLSRIINFGTGGYPRDVARRLRAFNATVLAAAAGPFVFAIVRLADPAPGMTQHGLITASFALILILLPLLHRFGPLVAPLSLILVASAFVFRTTLQVGTAGGTYLPLLTVAALAVLFIGHERIWLTAGFSVVGAGMIIALNVMAPDSTGLIPQGALFITFVINVVFAMGVVLAVMHYAVREIARAEASAEREHQRSEALLINILPASVATRLKQQDAMIADSYAEASVLFADISGFTERAADTPPEELVSFLNGVFTRLDELVERHGLEKIKTSGDAYMVVSGVPVPRTDHAPQLADLALAMRDALAGLADPRGRAVGVRIGLASGPIVAGVVGTRKFFYDVWGDAVNVASRMETTGEAGKIHVAPETAALLAAQFELEDRGVVEVRGKGPMRTSFLIARKQSVAQAMQVALTRANVEADDRWARSSRSRE